MRGWAEIDRKFERFCKWRSIKIIITSSVWNGGLATQLITTKKEMDIYSCAIHFGWDGPALLQKIALPPSHIMVTVA